MAQILVNKGVQHQSWLLAHGFHDNIKLARAANQTPEMFLKDYVFELRQACARDAVNGFAGRIGYKVNVKNRQPGLTLAEVFFF